MLIPVSALLRSEFLSRSDEATVPEMIKKHLKMTLKVTFSVKIPSSCSLEQISGRLKPPASLKQPVY